MSSIRLASIQARAIDCGFQTQKLQTSRVASPMSRWPHFGEQRATWMWPTKKVFVRIESTDGAVGWSCTNGGEIVAMIIETHLSQLIAGSEVNDIAELWDQMFLSLLPCDRSGFSMMAIAGVDIALWDLQAQTMACSLFTLLGGETEKQLPVYATTQRPEACSDTPYWGLKAAMPYGPEAGSQGLADNVQYLTNFRELAGPSQPIMLDAFMAWDADYTLRFHEAAHHLGLYWIEDPLPPYDIDGLRLLRHELGKDVRLALGNFCFNRWDCKQLMDEGLVDVLQPDVAWAGGISECLAILSMAEEVDLPVILHNTCEQPWAVAIAGACQTDAIIEFVDRGDESPLYSLMGPAADVSQGWLNVGTDQAANQAPAFVDNQFEHHDASTLDFSRN